MADRADISVNALNRLEREEVDPRMSTLQAITGALTKAGIEFSSDGVRLYTPTGQRHFASKRQVFEHSVQFYENDTQLVGQAADFIRAGLHAGDTAIVIATKPHRDKLEKRLRMDISRAAARHPRAEQYVALDAADALSKVSKHGWPDEGRVSDWIGSILKRATDRGNGRVRVFGEIVGLLCAEGKHEAAIRLEELWNGLAKVHSFSLLCAYPMRAFPRKADTAPFLAICNEHRRVEPAKGQRTRRERGRAIP